MNRAYNVRIAVNGVIGGFSLCSVELVGIINHGIGCNRCSRSGYDCRNKSNTRDRSEYLGNFTS